MLETVRGAVRRLSKSRIAPLNAIIIVVVVVVVVVVIIIIIIIITITIIIIIITITISSSSSINVEIAFILTLFHWLNHLTDEGGEETGMPSRKPPATSFRKCHIPRPENSSPKQDSNTHNSIGGRLGKQTC